MTAALLSIAQASDPRKAILDKVGDLSNVELFAGRILIGIYIGPEKTAGGIIRPTSNVREDIWQGTIGLVLKKGPLAFVPDEQHNFGGQDVQVGDWVLFSPGDGRRTQIRGVDCRIMEDVHIAMVISDPTIITHDK